MLEHIDLKLGKPELPLKKEYILQLQKIIVYFNVRAGHLTLQKERQLRRQYFEYKKWAKYKEVIMNFQEVRLMRHLEFTESACRHLGITNLNQAIKSVPYKELMMA